MLLVFDWKLITPNITKSPKGNKSVKYDPVFVEWGGGVPVSRISLPYRHRQTYPQPDAENQQQDQKRGRWCMTQGTPRHPSPGLYTGAITTIAATHHHSRSPLVKAFNSVFHKHFPSLALFFPSVSSILSFSLFYSSMLFLSLSLSSYHSHRYSIPQSSFVYFLFLLPFVHSAYFLPL